MKDSSTAENPAGTHMFQWQLKIQRCGDDGKEVCRSKLMKKRILIDGKIG